MKMIFNGVVYDTETAKLIAKYYDVCNGNDLYSTNEEIYQTKNGRYFLYAKGGALSQYKKVGYGTSSSGVTIKPLTENDVFEFLQNWNKVDLIESLFPSRIEEA